MVECLCFSGKSTAANAMNEFVRVKEWQNIYVQKVECWSFGNHDKAALLIVIAMSYTFTHPLTHSRSMYLHNHTKIVCENYLLNSELLTHHTPCLCTPHSCGALWKKRFFNEFKHKIWLWNVHTMNKRVWVPSELNWKI